MIPNWVAARGLTFKATSVGHHLERGISQVEVLIFNIVGLFKQYARFHQ